MGEKKIRVGRRFSKREVDKLELAKFARGPVLGIELSEEGHAEKQIKEEDLSFAHCLEVWKRSFTEFLNSRGLPCDPFWYPTKTALKGWQSTPPKDLTREDFIRERISLDKYLVWLGYEFDTLEYLAGKALYLIHLIENTIDVDKNPGPLHALFHLGATVQLSSVYLQLTLDNIKGGKSKKNPWRAYGKQLLASYPDKSQQQIWRKIPSGFSGLMEEEPDTPDTCGIFLFYRAVDDDKEVLVAKNDKTGEIEGTLAFNSFRTRYLLKNPTKK